MAQGRSTKIISMMKWIRTSRLSIKHSLSVGLSHLGDALFHLLGDRERAHEHGVRLDPVRGQPCVMLDGLHEHENATVPVCTNTRTQQSASARTRKRNGPCQPQHETATVRVSTSISSVTARGHMSMGSVSIRSVVSPASCFMLCTNTRTQRSASARTRKRNGPCQYEHEIATVRVSTNGQ